MKRQSSPVRWLLVSAILVLSAAVVVGSVVAGQFRAPDAAAYERDLETGSVIRVAEIAAVDGLPARGVFVQETDDGLLCLWDAPTATSPERGGGCNPGDDPLGGSPISASLAYEGGPTVESVRDARISGLAAPRVASVRTLMSDGTFRSIKLKRSLVGSLELHAFGYRIRRADLRRGIGPTAIVAYDDTGAEVGRQTTGIG